MESSPTFRLRTAVMVFSMIALPLAAVCGFKLPKFLGGTRSDRFESTSSASNKPSKSDRFRTASEKMQSRAPMPTATPTAAAQNIAVAARSNGGSPQFEGTTSSPGSASTLLHEANTDVRTGSVTPATALEPLDATRLYPLPSPETEVVEAKPLPPEAAADQFSTIQQRLRALGATHYSLETWGTQGEMYRFQCRMSAGHHPNYTRQFEATDSDPLRVMRTVLEEVEAWKSGRLP